VDDGTGKATVTIELPAKPPPAKPDAAGEAPGATTVVLSVSVQLRGAGRKEEGWRVHREGAW